MKNVRELIYLAALLHDIGKFYQRADEGSVAASRYLSEAGKYESTFCPVWQGRYSHKHVLWTAQFIEDFSPMFRRFVDVEIDDQTGKDSLISLAAGHHLAKEQLSSLGRIIKEADSLSSGMDRELAAAMGDEQDEGRWDSFKRKRMVSVMETIGRTVPVGKDWLHLPVRKLEFSKTYFPQDSFDGVPDYSLIWRQFTEELQALDSTNCHAFSETLLNLLGNYASCIPSSTVHFPDISLYDHLKTTAALTVCLHDVQQSKEQPKARFLLIGADICGIQSYIYHIVSEYAGKNLKGRSFYIRMLADSIVRYLLKKLHLFQANVIYNSGGGFYLLAPNTEFIRTQLEKAIKVIESQIFKTHGTALYVAIDSIPLSDDALMHRNGSTLSQAWADLFSKREEKKNRKFDSLIIADYDSFFKPSTLSGERMYDRITGEEILPGEKICSEGELKPLRPLSKAQIFLGCKLRDFNILIISDGALPYWNDKYPMNPLDLGFYYYFLKQDDLEKMKVELRASADRVTILLPNDFGKGEKLASFMAGQDNVYGYCFYGGNETKGNNVPTFEDLCSKPMDGEAFRRMGILRMDVDNLGSIFQYGISPERSTLSRFAALSRSFDYFFSGYLNEIWRTVSPRKSLIIYSGGDDVFIVGSWEVTIEIAKRIQKDFSHFVCYNPAFTISGGIVFLPPKYPIMKGAEESATEEERAKSHLCGNIRKNALSFLGMAMNWNEELPAVESLKIKIVNLLAEDNLKKAFISKVLSHACNAQFVNHEIKNYKTYWMLSYDLGRMKMRVQSSEAKTLISQCVNESCNKVHVFNGKERCTCYHPLELWALACRWAEIEMRTYKL